MFIQIDPNKRIGDRAPIMAEYEIVLFGKKMPKTFARIKYMIVYDIIFGYINYLFDLNLYINIIIKFRCQTNILKKK